MKPDEHGGYVWQGDRLLHVDATGRAVQVADAEEFPCLVRQRRYGEALAAKLTTTTSARRS